MVPQAGLSREALEADPADLAAQVSGQAVQGQIARVVPGVLIGFAGVAQAHDEKVDGAGDGFFQGKTKHGDSFRNDGMGGPLLGTPTGGQGCSRPAEFFGMGLQSIMPAFFGFFKGKFPGEREKNRREPPGGRAGGRDGRRKERKNFKIFRFGYSFFRKSLV